MSLFTQKSVVVSFLLIATLAHAHSDYGFKLDAINKQALLLKDRCESVKAFVDCMMTNCCGGGGSCPCAPTPITASTTEITEPGSYCFSEDVFSSITVTTDKGVVIDLNGHTVSSLVLGDNAVVKNGRIFGLGVGSNTLVSNVRVTGVTGSGAGSSALLIDCSRLTSLQNVERVVMVRCTGDGTSIVQISSGVKDLTLYDSSFPRLEIKSDALDFERLALYRSMIKGNLEFEYDSGGSDYVYALREMSIFQSIIGGEIQLWGWADKIEHLLIEESQIGRVGMYIVSSVEGSVPQKTNALFARSVFAGGVIEDSLIDNNIASVSVQKFDGLTIQKSELTGTIGLGTDNNVHLDNISVNCPNGGSAIDIGDGKNILCTDCCVTASWQDWWGYTTSASYGGGPRIINFIRCYAQGCYNGFDPILTHSCLLKDCVCDGVVATSFRGYDVTNRAVGNIALSVAGIPATNFNPSSGEPFDPLVVNASSISTDDATNSRWRNVSFELP